MTRLNNDLISRKALLAEVKLVGKQPLPDVRTLKDLEQAIVNTYHAILNLITNAPTVEADSGEIAELKADNERLQAQINELLNNVQMILDNDGADGSKCFNANKLYSARNKAKEALAKTPAQCLIQHDNDVIERCANMLENSEGELKYLPEYVALLRKLKG